SNLVASGDFSATSTCGQAIAAGSHCSISLAFNPAAVGNRIGTLTITDGLGVQNVALAGKGVSGPLVSFSTATQIYAAGNTTSPPFPVIVTNIGNAALNMTGFELTNGPAFGFGSTTCFASLAPLASCIINV